MGAFFLYRSDTTVNLAAVGTLFRAKGFATPAVHQFGGWTLWHYRKQLLPDTPLSVSGRNTTLFALGTFTYQGRGCRASLEAILRDYEAGTLEWDAVRGAYCFLLWTLDGMTVATDRLNLLQVFTNRDQNVFSSSFAAVLKAGPRKFGVNVAAVIENTLTGFVSGPETVADGVFVVDHQHRRQLRAPEIQFRTGTGLAPGVDPPGSTTFETCVAEQIAELDQYFALFKTLAEEAGGVDIGLSGGYDSRLLLLIALRQLPQVVAHTHYHKRATDDEIIAQQIAAQLGVPIRLVQDIREPAEMTTEEFERNIADTAAYTDGRVFHDYDWLTYTRTRGYREQVLGPLRLGMNGLGGELYRNFYNQILGSASTRDWIKARVLGPGGLAAVSRAALENTVDRVSSAISSVLGTSVGHRLSHQQLRRFFGEVWSVYCLAIRTSVDNQLAFSLSPYLDYPLRQASYRALPHLGVAGCFEGAMIRRLSPEVAALNSTYGYSFAEPEPLLPRLKYVLRGGVPLGVQNRLHACRLTRRRPASPLYEALYERQPLVRRAVEIMRQPCLQLKWERVVQQDTVGRRAVSMGLMLLQYEDCLRF